MIWTRKQFDREMERRFAEADRVRWQNERLECMQREIDDLRSQLFDLRMKTDPEFQRRNTPVCDCTNVCAGP